MIPARLYAGSDQEILITAVPLGRCHISDSRCLGKKRRTQDVPMSYFARSELCIPARGVPLAINDLDGPGIQ